MANKAGIRDASDGAGKGAFAAFYRQNVKPLIWWLHRMGADMATAEDLAQDAMLQLLAQWEDAQSPKALVWTIASRGFQRSLRAAARRRARERTAGEHVVREQAVLSQASVLMFDIGAEVRTALRMLAELPLAQREVMALTMDGFEPAEIATITGRNQATVRSHLRHARRKLIALRAQEGGVSCAPTATPTSISS